MLKPCVGVDASWPRCTLSLSPLGEVNLKSGSVVYVNCPSFVLGQSGHLLSVCHMSVGVGVIRTDIVPSVCTLMWCRVCGHRGRASLERGRLSLSAGGQRGRLEGGREGESDWEETEGETGLSVLMLPGI